VLFARTLGGARACEATRLDWGMLDRETFAKCIIARGKTRAFQALIVPDMLRPFLRAWWNAAGQPETGPVFPVRRGPRKGRQRATSLFAPRFRRALLKAGVTRHEVHKDTAYSRRTDFHTLRREYVSALASANVNEQTAMALASHSSSAVHKRYQLAQINALPASALPLFNADIANSIGCRPANSNRRAVQVPVTMSGTPDSNRRHSAWEESNNRESSQFSESASVADAPSDSLGFTGRHDDSAATAECARAQTTSFERVHGGVIFTIDPSVPDAIAAMSEAMTL
jgi:hypothetical protein